MGRVSVDLYAEQPGRPLREVTSFRKSIGGTATNVAVAASRLGRRVALVTRVGDDPFGDYVRHALRHTFGVDTRFIGVDPDLKTPLAFAELTPPESPNLVFYREPKAPDMNLTAADLTAEELLSVPILWIPASRAADEPSRSAVMNLLQRRNRRGHVILDLDWRPMFWQSEEEARNRIRPMLELVTVAIGNRKECQVVVGTDRPNLAADRLSALGLDAAVVKMGDEGVLVAETSGERTMIPSYPVEVVCGLGAGDAFGGAFCHVLLNGHTFAEAARYGNAAGAVVAARLMCADDMPTLSDVEHMITQGETPP